MKTSTCKDLVSIIVPVHNGENTIERCINSILHQKYENIEIIIVDDNSSDSTEMIIQKLKNNHSNIVSCSLDDGSKGVSYARNTGLKLVTGEYVGFVDADDYISEDMYLIMVSKMKQQNLDVVICAYSFIYDNHKPVLPTSQLSLEYEEMFTAEDAILELMKMQDAVFTGHVWDKLYRRSVIEKVKFVEEVHCYEDTLFNVEVMLKTNRIFFFNKPLYSYYINSNSITNSGYTDKIYSSISALEKMEHLDSIKNNGVLFNAVQSRILRECISQSYKSIISPKWSNYVESFRKIAACRIKRLGTTDLTFKEKGQIVLLVYAKEVYKYIIRNKQ